MNIQKELSYISDNTITEVVFDTKEILEKFNKGDILIHNDNRYKVLIKPKKVRVSALKNSEKEIYKNLPNKTDLKYMIRVLAL